MIDDNKLRELNKELTDQDVEMRVQQITKSGYMILLVYKTARVDANRLDSVIGPSNWHDEYIHRDGIVYCKVSINTNNGWITKEDCGEPDKTNPKSTASDAFKRACFKWGIGRELYDYPFLCIKLEDKEYEADNKGKIRPSKACKFGDWKIKKDGKNISVLDASGKVRQSGEVSGGKGKDVSGETDVVHNDKKVRKVESKKLYPFIQDILDSIEKEHELQSYAKQLNKQGDWNEEVAALFTKRKEIINGNK